MVGNFSQYYKTTATFPNAQNTTAWGDDVSVACSFEPKVVFFHGGDSTVAGNIFAGAFIFDCDNNGNHINAGVVEYLNSAGTAITRGVYTGYDVGTEGSSKGGTNLFRYYEGLFQATKQGNDRRYSTTDTYTFEFYG